MLNLWLCLEAMAECELINPFLQMGKPRLRGGGASGWARAATWDLPPGRLPTRPPLFPLGRGPSADVLGNVLTLSRSATVQPAFLAGNMN